jgi:hypothetical protein
MSDPLALLARPDKWFLSASDGIVYAPPFPRWLDAPGFWDEATLHHYSFAPLFTVSAVDADGRELAMRPGCTAVDSGRADGGLPPRERDDGE